MGRMSSEPAQSPSKSDPCLPLPRSIEYEWMSVATWQALHAQHVAEAARGEAEILWVGDSITQGWLGTQVWGESFGCYRNANAGIGGDATQNVLWRLEHGGIGALQPGLVVVLIGVNNLGREEHSPEQTLAGVAAIIARLQQAFPRAKLLLNAILPADESPDSPFRKRIEETNTLLCTFACAHGLDYLDPTQELLDSVGRLSTDLVPDGVLGSVQVVWLQGLRGRCLEKLQLVSGG